MKSKMSCIANPMIPASNLLPDIVCVLPDPLWPYANTVPIQTRIIKYYIVKVCVLYVCTCMRAFVHAFVFSRKLILYKICLPNEN